MKKEIYRYVELPSALYGWIDSDGVVVTDRDLIARLIQAARKHSSNRKFHKQSRDGYRADIKELERLMAL